MAFGNWRTQPFGDLIENLDAIRVPVKESDRRAGPYPYYGASGVVDYIDSYLFDGLHLLIAEDGENLRTRKLPIAFLADGKFWVNNHAHVVRGNARADTRFLMYAMMVADVGSFLTGSTMPKLTQGNLNRIPIFAPDRDEQIAVANILGSFDDKIELNRRMNETLEAMAQAIYRDWFVDFGPTRRKLTGLTDPIEIMGGLTPDPAHAAKLAALFPDALGDNGLPEGWDPSTVGDLFHLNPSEPLGRGVVAPYTDMASLPTRGCTADPPIDRAFGSGMKFRNGDALLARITPCLENGKAAFVDFLPTDQTIGWGSTEFIVFRSRPPAPMPMAYLLLRHQEFRTRAIQSMTGTSGRQRAQADSLRSFEMARPPDELLQKLGTLVEPMFSQIRANAAQNQTLAATRDLLLPKLMSGEIRLRDAVQIAQEAGA